MKNLLSSDDLKIRSQGICLRLFLALLTIVSILAIRIPFLDKPLTGEEGMHAMLLVQSPSSNDLFLGTKEKESLNSCLTLIGNIDGRDIFVRPGRNLAPYCFFNKGIKPIVSPFFRDQASFEDKTIFARSIFLSISTLGYLALVGVCFMGSLRLRGISIVLPFLILLYAASTVLSVGSSIQPQLDGSLGVSLLGFSFFLVALDSAYLFRVQISIALIFLAGYLAAFCKNEWPLALAGSILVCLTLRLIMMFWIKKDQNSKNSFNIPIKLLFLVLGLGAGMLTCFLISPNDYLSGYKLMQSIGSQKYSPTTLMAIFRDLLNPLGILLLIAISMTLLSLKVQLHRNFILLVYLVFAAGIGVGFISSGWLGDGFPRYFAPSMLLVAGYIAAVLPTLFDDKKPYLTAICIAIIGLGLVQNFRILNVYREATISITVPGDTNWIKNDIVLVSERSQANPNQVFIAHSSVIYYFPKTQFVSMDYGESGAREILKIINDPRLELVGR
jgi:hypothetical protein